MQFYLHIYITLYYLFSISLLIGLIFMLFRCLQSHFKMHRKTSKAQKRQRVNELLLLTGLRDAAHTRIQQLSGGERKRLSLAEEVKQNQQI